MSCECGTTGDNGSGCGCSLSSSATASCPACGTIGRKVSSLTIQSQFKKEMLENYKDHTDKFNFCMNPSCPAVYYDDSESIIIHQDEIRSKVTIKNDDLKTPLCYCKKLLKSDFFQMIEDNIPDISDKIKAIISEGKSFCEKSNPKGVCCTEDVKTFLAEYGMAWESQDASRGCC
ncbi:hypothetical protein [Sulfuricurvum sp. MLSB]|uniref:hypothetical protein n=2 Tax=unclassified Sulfuricurvum TaxID=2632390 RepID=UPI0026003EA4|nr:MULTISPECIES: hypothetical protein [unclassified Sulfuricurvum]